MKQFYSALAFGCLIVSVSSAQHSDIEVAIEDGAVVIEERIAEGEFGSELNPANTTDDPGFAPEGGEDTPPTTTFAPNQQLGFETVNLGSTGTNLLFWDGTGSPSFGASPHGLTIEADGFPETLSLPGANGGFTFLEADGGGFFDDHLEFTLDSPTPAEGVYVYALTLNSPNASPAVDPSESIFFVMASQGLDEAIHEAGIDYVAANFVPEPSSAMLGLLAAGAILANLRRRRR